MLCIICLLSNFFSQTDGWQVIDNSDPFRQLQKIRQQQKEAIQKLRREGFISKRSCESSEDEENSYEVDDNGNNSTNDISLPVSEDRVDGSILQNENFFVTQMVPSGGIQPTKSGDHGGEDMLCDGEIPILEQESLQEKSDGEAKLTNQIQESEQEVSTDTERMETENTPPLKGTSKWTTDDFGESDDEDITEDEDSTHLASLSCLIQVVVGLLEMLEAVLKYSSDTTTRTLLAEALHIDQVIVMANHPQPVIRCAVLKVSLLFIC